VNIEEVFLVLGNCFMVKYIAVCVVVANMIDPSEENSVEVIDFFVD
jgi:hypothetical protein